MDSSKHVFISHSTLDQTWAQGICDALEAGGLRCWLAPRDMAAGVDWPAQIVEAIANAALMVLILSEPANRSPQVLREVDRAVNHGVNVLALRIGNFPLSKNLEYFISMCHWLDAVGITQDECIRQVCVNAQAILAKGGTPAPAHTFAGAAQPRAVILGEVPGVPSLPAGINDPAFLRRVETELALHLGPIARHLVRQAAAQATSNQGLVTALATELSSDAERRQFLLRCRGLS
jgi:hypothetical protein